MIVGRPGHAAKVGEAARVRAVKFHRVNVRVDSVGVEAAPNDTLAVWGEKRTAIVTPRERQPLLAGAVGVHEVDFAKVTRIGSETLPDLGRKFR